MNAKGTHPRGAAFGSRAGVPLHTGNAPAQHSGDGQISPTQGERGIRPPRGSSDRLIDSPHLRLGLHLARVFGSASFTRTRLQAAQCRARL
ncbi:hypothetical protein AAFF_G00113740 [Aldrovandia affinis]|uniref:Uncharacterized protein n=1 Tax=Aldrovandia affinis TaxID=143900 RepID=A0AAD7RTJ0_9TELE|nr:hypothetical protein AAFF_G00113740 [Aldrovandia affinis]